MTKTMLIDAAHAEEVRVCVLENGKVEDFDFESSSRKPLRGNIYLARVTRVEPSLQAAFIEYGGNRHGFLAFNEIHPDYYQIPVSDRRLLQEAEAEEAALAAELELDRRDDEPTAEEVVDGAGGPGRVRDEEHEAPDFRDLEAAEPVAEEAAPVDAGAAAQDVEAHEPAESDGNVARLAADDEAAIVGDATLESGPAAEAADANARESESAAEPVLQTGAEQSLEGAADRAPGVSPKRGRTQRRAELLDRYREARRKRARLMRNYKIQEVVKRRQILLVQVVKEERGNKGAALTTYLSLAGRYCVLMPNTARGGGISRKIPIAVDRKRLRRVVDSLDVPKGMGLIIRTAGAKRTKAEIKRDYDYLIRLWENIRTLTLQSIAPCLIYEEASLIKRAIRDLYDKDIDKIVVQGDDGYREAKDFMKMLMPSHARNVQAYKEKVPLFLAYNVESQLDAIYQPLVRLKSGGYMVIHQTEALVAIDVNSGKATRERNIELTALRTNLEAAKEAARQARLRDLAGLIVIDFIDMEEPRNNRAVEKKLKEALKSDRARIQLGRISNFGLLEMSRQRRRSGLVEGTSHACPTCAGAGTIRSHEMAALRILRAVEAEAIAAKAGTIAVKASLEVTLYILNHKREWLKRIENDYGLSVLVLSDATKAGDQFDLEKSGTPREAVEAPVVRADAVASLEAAEEAAEEDEELVGATAEEERVEAAADDADSARTGRKRRRRRRRRRDEGAPVEVAGDEPRADGPAMEGRETPAEFAPPEETAAESRSKRRRGRRGGRRNRRPEGGREMRPSEIQADQPPYEAPINAECRAVPEGASGDAVDAREPLAAQPEQSVKPGPQERTSIPEPLEPRIEVREHAELEERAEPAKPAEDAREGRPGRRGWWQRAIGG